MTKNNQTTEYSRQKVAPAAPPTKPKTNPQPKTPRLRFGGFEGEWEEKKLEELDIYVSDGNYGEMYPKANQMTKTGVPFIRANNIKNSKVVWDDMKYISKELHQILKSGHLKNKDILITTRGEIGMLGYVGKDFEGANINAQICLLRCGSGISPKFILNFLLSNIGQRQFKALQTGTALKQLPKGNLAKVKIFLPPLPEQEKIASFLSVVDEWVENLKGQKEDLEKYKKGVMQKLFPAKGKQVPQLRFSGFTGNWEEKKLGEVGDIYQPKTISQNVLTKEGYYVYGANGIIGKYKEYNHEYEQIALTCRGNTCGTVNYTKPKSWITGNAMVVNLDNSKTATKRFIYYQLCNTNFGYLITGSGQPQITGDIKKHKIYLPSLPEQEKIASFLTALDDIIEKTEQKISQAEQWKKGLMHRLFV